MTTEANTTQADAGRHERGVRPSALAEALRGIADGFDQQRPWFRPDELVMHTLRRAADELEKADAAEAVERERCAAVARRWGETHESHVTVNARNAADKIARAIEGPNVGIEPPERSARLTG